MNELVTTDNAETLDDEVDEAAELLRNVRVAQEHDVQAPSLN